MRAGSAGGRCVSRHSRRATDNARHSATRRPSRVTSPAVRAPNRWSARRLSPIFCHAMPSWNTAPRSNGIRSAARRPIRAINRDVSGYAVNTDWKPRSTGRPATIAPIAAKTMRKLTSSRRSFSESHMLSIAKKEPHRTEA